MAGQAHNPDDAAPISLPVLSTDARSCATRTIKPSKNAKRRACVLILLHVFMAIHIVQWLITGMTLSPIEPSESMDTLRDGSLNAGFVFFAGALVLTFFFGRFVCGWACHIVALQDLCTVIMKRMRFRPKPWRTRLLVYMPVLLALYMFVWPVFHRELLTPYYPTVAGWLGLQTQMPIWMGRSAPLSGFSTEFLVADFWATFPPWYIAVPFLIVCTLGCVYFLGSKGFCTYACPYAGFFGPVDKVSIGKIVVNDSCEQCGHCTAVCSSNVRVHEEIRDFGAVVDSGCMKTMDCISVCPNNALAFRFAKPSLLTRPRDATANQRQKVLRNRSHTYDLSRSEELVFGALFIALTLAYRGMLNQIPLLMAGGLGAIATFLLWKLWRLVRVQNVRFHSFQLRKRGSITLAGMGFVAVALSIAGTAAWSGHIRFHRWQTELIDASLTVDAARVFTAGYVPDDAVRDRAERALWHASFAAPKSEGGIGWARKPGDRVRLAWLHCVAGQFADAELILMDVAEHETADMALVESILNVMRSRGATDDDRLDALETISDWHPDLLQLQVLLAQSNARTGDTDKAMVLLRAVLTSEHADIASIGPAVELMAGLGAIDEATQLLTLQVERSPDIAETQFLLGVLYAQQQQFSDAISHIERAAEVQPENLALLQTLAELAEVAGDTERAEKLRKKVRELNR